MALWQGCTDISGSVCNKEDILNVIFKIEKPTKHMVLPALTVADCIVCSNRIAMLMLVF
ncbi:uncharacterized protein DS421_3g96650 [Arachis hypogaea]|nr:uncharacterized protein DS421_3g96650 [Arachis hypogaea]